MNGQSQYAIVKRANIVELLANEVAHHTKAVAAGEDADCDVPNFHARYAAAAQQIIDAMNACESARDVLDCLALGNVEKMIGWRLGATGQFDVLAVLSTEPGELSSKVRWAAKDYHRDVENGFVHELLRGA